MENSTASMIPPPFITSAPGKVIVFGEHAVVHGKAAMAASVSLRSYLLVTTLSRTDRTVSMKFPDIGLDHTWQIDDLPWDVFGHPDKKRLYYDRVTSTDPELVKAMQPHISTVSPRVEEAKRRIHAHAASSFLYLYLSLGSPTFPGCVYTLRSTLPIGAGLGSSASISVCISAALLVQIRALSGPHPDQPSEESRLQVERINQWAFVGELLIHGNPSGVDNTVASAGKAVIFKRGDYTKPPSVRYLPDFPELPLILVDTKQTRSTAIEVAKVAALKKSHPDITNHILDAIDQVTESAEHLVSSSDFEVEDDGSVKALGDLFKLNQGLLVALGVSHPKLERIKELADSANIGWTKLTGAGGGGCAITLLRPPVDKQRMKELEKQLVSEGFEIYETSLGESGVGVLSPASLKSGKGGAREDIDQQKFLSVQSREGLERLIGVGPRKSREEWQFWI